MNLAEMVKRLESGESTVETIEAEILSYADLYPANPPRNDDEIDAWFERRQRLAREVEELNRAMAQETDSLQFYRKGRILVTATSLLDNDEWMVTANYFVGEGLTTRGQYSQSLPFLSRAEQHYYKVPDYRDEPPLPVIFLKVMNLSSLKSYGQLEEESQRWLPTLSAPEHRKFKVFVLSTLAMALRNLSRYDKAIETCREGLQVIEQAGRTARQELEEKRFELYHVCGEAARMKGSFEEALEAFAKARATAIATGNRYNAALALSEQGDTWKRIGEHERGYQLLEEAAQEAEHYGHHKDAARWRAELSEQSDSIPEKADYLEMLLRAGAMLRHKPPRTEEARQIALNCIKRAQEKKDLDIEADARGCLAKSYAEEGRYAQALPAMRAALRLAERLSDKSREQSFRTNLAILLMHNWRVSDAEEELRKAIEIGRATRRSARTTEFRQAITAGLSEAYNTLALIQCQSWEGHDGKHLPARSDKLIEAAQEIRASNFASWLAAEAHINAYGPLKLGRALRELRAADVGLEMGMLDKAAQFAPLLDAREGARQKFQRAAAARGVEVEFTPPLFSAAELGTLLSPEQALVDLYATGKQVIITLLGPDERLQSRACSSEQEERVRLLRGWQAYTLDQRGSERAKYRFRTEPQIEENDAEITLEVLLAELRRHFVDELLEMLAEYPAVRHLIIVPHRELALVPFWMLAESLPELRISIMPGTNIFKLIAKAPRRTNGPRLALGDATNTLKYVPQELACLPDFTALPHDVHQVLAQLGKANMLHLSGHGTFDPHNPYRSGLIVQRQPAQPPLRFGAQTGYDEELLTVAEVLAEVTLPRCYLTVLSACWSGLPRDHSASEFVGLPMSFLIAGARNVIGSLWPVNDGATCIMMQEFYATLFQKGKLATTPSQALAIARERLRRLPREEVLARLGAQATVPAQAFPFADPEFTFAFQHFGVN